MRMYTHNYFRERFSDLYNAVLTMHAQSPLQHRGHGFDHDITVAQMTQEIVSDDSLRDKVWVAGMVHSVDRVVKPAVVEETTRTLVAQTAHVLSELDREEVIQAALRHSEKNQDDQSVTQIILMDADRLVNLQPLIIIRAAQHYPHIPAIVLDHIGDTHPESTHVNPQSVLDNLRSCLEWETWFRIPEAQRRATEACVYIRDYITRAEETYHQLGLVEDTEKSV